MINDLMNFKNFENAPPRPGSRDPNPSSGPGPAPGAGPGNGHRARSLARARGPNAGPRAPAPGFGRARGPGPGPGTGLVGATRSGVQMLAVNPTFRKRRVKQPVRSSAQGRHEVRRSMVNNAQIHIHCNCHGKDRPTLVTSEGPMKSPPELVTPKIGHDRSDENLPGSNQVQRWEIV